MTLQEKIEEEFAERLQAQMKVAKWIIEESNEPITHVESLLNKIYRHSTTRIDEDWEVLWEDDKTTKEEN